MREFSEEFLKRLAKPGIPAICVSVMGSTVKEVKESLTSAVMARPDCIEFRADSLSVPFECEIAAPEIGPDSGGLPLIFTYRTKKEGGASEITDEDYVKLLTKAAEENWADLIDVECIDKSYDVKRLIEDIHDKGAAVVGSYHNFYATPSVEEIVSLLGREAELGADVLKAAFMPKTRLDVLHVMEATVIAKEKFNKSIVTMSMGRSGRLSRLTGGFTGSCLTFGSAGKESAPGQIGALTLRKEICELYSYWDEQ